MNDNKIIYHLYKKPMYCSFNEPHLHMTLMNTNRKQIFKVLKSCCHILSQVSNKDCKSVAKGLMVYDKSNKFRLIKCQHIGKTCPVSHLFKERFCNHALVACHFNPRKKKFTELKLKPNFSVSSTDHAN